MKKILSVILCCCLLLSGGALSIHANVKQPPVSIMEEDTIEEIMEFVSLDNMTGEISYETLSYTPEARGMSNGNNDNVRPAYIPESVKPVEMEGGVTTRDVIGSDNRTKITGTTTFPYSAVCCFDTSDGGGGTAWMIGPNIAVTAAHCIYNDESGTRDSISSFWAGKKGPGDGWWLDNHNPFGTTSVTNIKYPAMYETFTGEDANNHERTRYDWAVLILADADLGYDTGWFGFGWTNSYPEDEGYTITGYPTDTENGIEKYYMYTAGGTVRGGGTPTENTLEDIILFHNVDTGKGQSGAPMYDSTYTVYGIQRKSYSYTTNIAVRITHDIFVCLDRIEEIQTISPGVFP